MHLLLGFYGFRWHFHFVSFFSGFQVLTPTFLKLASILAIQYFPNIAFTLNGQIGTSPSGTPAELLATAEQSHVADPAAAAAMTFAAGSIDTGTDMTAAEAAAIVTDLAALKTAIDANNAAIDSILTTLETTGLHATS